MLIFESDLLNALDFLFIISGAPVESIENRLLKDQQLERAYSLQLLKEERDRRNGFYLLQDDNRFLEVFYLKMAFLDQIVRRVFPNLASYKYPELGCSLDRIWIQFVDASNMIPRSWSFKVRLIQDDLDKETAKPPSFPKSPPAYGYYFLGSIWLFTLVLNRRQGSTTICSAAEKMVEQNPSAGNSERPWSGGALDPVFLPENIYWKPDANQKPDKGRKLWEKTIKMGLSLLKEGLNPSQSVIPEGFIQELDFLRGEIRKLLFQKRSFAAPGPRLSREDLEIRNILVQIRNHLAEHAEEGLSTENSSNEELRGDEEELMGTIVLKRNTITGSRSAENVDEHPNDANEPDMPKTEVIRPASLKVEGVFSENKNEGTTEEAAEGEMAETVLSYQKSSETGADSEEQKNHTEQSNMDDDIIKTVVISSGKAQKEKNEIEPDGELEETVILHRRNFEKNADEEDGDLMSETVILRPGGTEKKE